jgi:hypothetical protein
MLGSIFGWGLALAGAVVIPMCKEIYEVLMLAAVWSVLGTPLCVLFWSYIGFLAGGATDNVKQS